MGIRPSLPTTKVPSVNSKKSPVVVTSSTSSPAALNNSKEDGGEIHVQHGGRMTEVTKKRLTREDVNLWSKSFDHLMQSEEGRKIFLDYLRSEFSEENILFWLACEDLKKEEDQEKVEEKARLIYEDYISILSPREVSLAGETRAIVNKNMLSPTNHAFEDAQLQIYRLMQRDSYPRFLNSRIYTKLLESQP